MCSACTNAGILEFIQSLPNGFDTVVGTNGIGLSRGQQQRIAIARIYLQNPKIIIFDEATSALDEKTENLIHKAWEKVLYNRTAIIIAHRQSSVMLSESVAIMEKGVIMEKGSPTVLMQNSKLFHTLFSIKQNPEKY